MVILKLHPVLEDRGFLNQLPIEIREMIAADHKTAKLLDQYAKTIDDIEFLEDRVSGRKYKLINDHELSWDLKNFYIEQNECEQRQIIKLNEDLHFLKIKIYRRAVKLNKKWKFLDRFFSKEYEFWENLLKNVNLEG